MNPRERMIALAVLTAVALVGGAFLFHQLYLGPLQDYDAQITAARKENEIKKERRDKVYAHRPQLQEWRELSLPKDVDHSRLYYADLLETMMRESGFRNHEVRPGTTMEVRKGPSLPGSQKKDPSWISLPFTVKGRGNMTSLVKLFLKFYRTPLMHRITALTISRPQNAAGAALRMEGFGIGTRELDLEFTVEAIIVNGAEDRQQLFPLPKREWLALDVLSRLLGGPAGLATLPWKVGRTGPAGPHLLAGGRRDYQAMASLDIFHGLPPVQQPPREGPDVAEKVFLKLVSETNDGNVEAWLYNDADERWLRLCPGEGIDKFKYENQPSELRVLGTVVRISTGEVVFRAGDKLYAIHPRQSLADALRRPLTDAQVKTMNLTRATGIGGP